VKRGEILRQWDAGCSILDIAISLGISESEASKLISKARSARRLRREIKEMRTAGIGLDQLPFGWQTEDPPWRGGDDED